MINVMFLISFAFLYFFTLLAEMLAFFNDQQGTFSCKYNSKGCLTLLACCFWATATLSLLKVHL